MTLLPFLTLRKAANIVTALGERGLRRTVCRSRPFVYRIDPCTACNLRCAGCSNPTSTKPRLVMKIEDFETIAGRIARWAVRASLYNEGEPLLNARLWDMCRAASDAGMSTLISTNFTLFRPEDAEELCRSRLTVLEPCLDGFTQSAYGKYRIGGDVEAVKAGIRAVMDCKRRLGLRRPYVDVQVVLFEHIRHELPEIKRFLGECGVDRVTFRADFHARGAGDGGDRPRSCFWLYLGMLVRPDGTVYPCCVRRGQPYGNLLESGLDEIWNNRFYRFSRALFSGGEDLPYDPDMEKIPCLGCGLFRRRRGMAAPPPDRA